MSRPAPPIPSRPESRTGRHQAAQAASGGPVAEHDSTAWTPGEIATRLRLATGLVLMAFVTTHFLNHALGLISLEALDQGRWIFTMIWRSWPGTILLYGALLGHVVLVLLKLYTRRTIRFAPWELAQIGLGLLIPFWLTVHVVGTRGIHEVFGVTDSYYWELDLIWPFGARFQTIMVLLVWIHGCIGVHFWLRLKAWYRRALPLMLTLAVLLPTLALLGFVSGGREVKDRAAADPAWIETLAETQNWPQPGTPEKRWIFATEESIEDVFRGALILLVAARAVRWLLARSKVRVTYPDGKSVAIAPGLSVLDASRAGGIPHASVCGGRGRCSTCRVRVTRGGEHLPPPGPEEVKVLQRIAASPDVRLACRIRPRHNLVVRPLLPPAAGPGATSVPVRPGQGVEREVVVLFADLRGFTRLAEGRLPYDVVFLLNQYFRAMGRAIESQGGRIDKFIGDGIMALFGTGARTDPVTAADEALRAVRAMGLAMERLNRELADDLGEPLRMGIGLHMGPVILGELGHGEAVSLTAIGDVVNVASRLEQLTKAYGAQLVVADEVGQRAGIDLGTFEAHEVEIRGRRQPLQVRVVQDLCTIPGPDLQLERPPLWLRPFTWARNRLAPAIS